MIKYKVANRYSAALFEVAKEENKIEKISKDLDLFSDIFSKNKEFRVVMETSAVSKKEKIEIVEDLGKKLNFDQITINFLKVLINKGKIKFIQTISQVFKKKFKDFMGIADFEVITAIKIDNKVLNKVKEILEKKTKKKIQISTKVDPEIIGGMIIKTEGLIYDGSLRHQLMKLKEKILKG